MYTVYIESERVKELQSIPFDRIDLIIIHKNLPSILPSAIFFSWNLHAEMSLSPTYAEHACACKCIIIYKYNYINLEV